MSMRPLAFIALLIALAFPAQAQQREARLVSDVDPVKVEILYTFSGVDLLVYGAIADYRPPAGRSVDVVAVVRGPSMPITVRRKSRVAGIWLNTDSVRFQTAPAFYALASNRPVSEFRGGRWLSIYEIGLNALHFSPATTGDVSAEDIAAFRDGFVRLRQRFELYSEQPRGITVIDNLLYRGRITLPAKVPVGRYRVDVYLFSAGDLIARSSTPVEVDKSGFERWIYVAAHASPLAYGIVAVALALLLGWLAGTTVRR
jgi:uncharacterized protein (TIGR02186 family)